MKKVLAFILALTLTGCALNPFNTAKTMEQKSYALYGSFVIVEEQAAKIMASREVPMPVKLGIQRADAAAKPAVDQLKLAADSVVAARRDLSLGVTDEGKLAIASANLAKWYYDARPKVECFIKLVQEKGPC